jgi:hypothetical protein
VADTFTGFPPTGIAFLAGLAADNAKTYFNANRDTYTNDLAVPLRALVVAVGERLRDTAVPDVCFEPSTGKSLFRINRDTRFSADKTPYHPWVDAIWWAGPDDARRAPAFISRLSADYLVAGVGIMGLRDTLWGPEMQFGVPCGQSGSYVVLVGEPAEDLFPVDPVLGEVDRLGRAGRCLSGGQLARRVSCSITISA